MPVLKMLSEGSPSRTRHSKGELKKNTTKQHLDFSFGSFDVCFLEQCFGEKKKAPFWRSVISVGASVLHLGQDQDDRDTEVPKCWIATRQQRTWAGLHWYLVVPSFGVENDCGFYAWRKNPIPNRLNGRTNPKPQLETVDILVGFESCAVNQSLSQPDELFWRSTKALALSIKTSLAGLSQLLPKELRTKLLTSRNCHDYKWGVPYRLCSLCWFSKGIGSGASPIRFASFI